MLSNCSDNSKKQNILVEKSFRPNKEYNNESTHKIRYDEILQPIIQLRDSSFAMIMNARDKTDADNIFVTFMKKYRHAIQTNRHRWLIGTYSRTELDSLHELINKSGLTIREDCEHGEYFDINTGYLIKKIAKYLSEQINDYYLIVDEEEFETLHCEGSLSITFSRLAYRIARWEIFLTTNPNIILKEDIESTLSNYIYFLIIPHENYFYFDNEKDGGQINKNLLLCLKEYVRLYPQTKFANYLRGLLLELKNSNYKYSENIKKYIQKWSEITGYKDFNA
ncbi:MAG: hypothetical protein Q8S39_14180 [Ignavibacteria bacterium]|nr:hypothetical protein [Ignavibacteria bacterium]